MSLFLAADACLSESLPSITEQQIIWPSGDFLVRYFRDAF